MDSFRPKAANAVQLYSCFVVAALYQLLSVVLETGCDLLPFYWYEEDAADGIVSKLF